MHESTRAIELCEQALALPEGGQEISIQVSARDVLGRSYFVLGDYRRAEAELTRNVTILADGFEHERFGSASLPSVMARHFLAFSRAELGEFFQAHEYATEALRIAEATSNRHAVVGSLAGVGYACVALGDHARSIHALEKAIDICREFQIRIWSPLIGSFLGYAYSLAGRLREAVELQEEALCQQRGFVWEAIHAARLGQAYLMAGRLDRARSLADAAIESSRRNGYRGWLAWTLHLEGEIAQAGDANTAEMRYNEARSLGDDLGMRPLVAHCHLGLGTLYRRTGERAQAQEHFATATAMYREMGMTYWLEKVQGEIRELESDV